MLTGRSGELLAALRQSFPSWNCIRDGENLVLSYGAGGYDYRPPRRLLSTSDVLERLSDSCAAYGIQRNDPLPLRGLSDAELTFSAVQALDPYLKNCEGYVYARGLVPQPAVRFTGPRDEHGTLQPGFATSFVNVSIIEAIGGTHEHAELMDVWIGVLSRLGFHARHLTISGNLDVWHRPPVSGITLRFHHEGHELGDAVLLWNRNDPSKLATDIGSGLERLCWARTRQSWPEVVYGSMAGKIDVGALDAIRTASLIVGNGIRPASRGPGNAVRRLLRPEAKRIGVLGASRIVRWAHAYWSGIQPLPLPWHEVCRIIDTEILEHLP